MTKIIYPKTRYYLVESKLNKQNLMINAESIYHAVNIALSYPIFENHKTIDFKIKKS
jgi:hypothetical protein|tara:strand:+ start:239 stop:409 length:171 start_codon:yes stop_codon:yes gene_type:complete